LINKVVGGLVYILPLLMAAQQSRKSVATVINQLPKLLGGEIF
jgi:hypothetical protein